MVCQTLHQAPRRAEGQRRRLLPSWEEEGTPAQSHGSDAGSVATGLQSKGRGGWVWSDEKDLTRNPLREGSQGSSCEQQGCAEGLCGLKAGWARGCRLAQAGTGGRRGAKADEGPYEGPHEPVSRCTGCCWGSNGNHRRESSGRTGLCTVTWGKTTSRGKLRVTRSSYTGSGGGTGFGGRGCL